eukprot:31287-Pelagococcus_subviridis.AAC.14
MTTRELSSAAPLTNASMLSALFSDVMSPLYITTGSPASTSAYSTAWHDGIVFANTIVFFPALKSPSMSCVTTAILSIDPGQSTNLCFKFGAARCKDGVSIFSIPGKSSSIVFTTLSDIVAETITQLFPSGFFCSGPRSTLMSSPNPASKSVSASSSTTCVTRPKYMFPSLTCFTSLPGVPTTTSNDRSSCVRCVANLSPPITSAEENLAWCDRLLATPATCSASSRVGETTSTLGRFGRARPPPTVAFSSRRMRWMIGSKYVSVFPEPVCEAIM